MCAPSTAATPIQRIVCAGTPNAPLFILLVPEALARQPHHTHCKHRLSSSRMKRVAFVCFIIIFGSWPTACALSPGEKALLREVFSACGGVAEWSTFSTRSTFHRTVERGGRVASVEDEDTVAQLQKEPRGNYATYVKASRKEASMVYSPGWYKVQEDVLRLEIMQGGDFLLKVVEASDKYFGPQIKALASEWFEPSNSNFKGRLPIGGEFADHVSLGVGRPMNLRESNLESVQSVASGKDFEGSKVKCVQANFRPHRRHQSQSRSMTFCFSDGKLIKVTEKVDSKPMHGHANGHGRNPEADRVQSTAIRTYTDINMTVNFPFEPAPFSLPREKRISRAEEQENPLLPTVSMRSVWVYLMVCGAGLVVLALVVSLISYSEINSLWAVAEREPLLGADDPAQPQDPFDDDDGPPLLV